MPSARAETVGEGSVSLHTELSTNVPWLAVGCGNAVVTSRAVPGEVGLPTASSAGSTASS